MLAVGVVALVPEVAQGVQLEVLPAHSAQALVDGPHERVEGAGRRRVHRVIDPVAARHVAGGVADEPLLVLVRVVGLRERRVGPDAGGQPLLFDVARRRLHPVRELGVRLQPEFGEACRALVAVVDLQVLVAVGQQNVCHDVGRAPDVLIGDPVEEREPAAPADDGLAPRGVGPRLEVAEAAVLLIEAGPEAEQDLAAAGVEREGAGRRASPTAACDDNRRTRMVVDRQHPVRPAVVDGLVQSAPAEARAVPDDRERADPAIAVGRERLRAGGDRAGDLDLSARCEEGEDLVHRFAPARHRRHGGPKGLGIPDAAVEQESAVVADGDVVALDRDLRGRVGRALPAGPRRRTRQRMRGGRTENQRSVFHREHPLHARKAARRRGCYHMYSRYNAFMWGASAGG